MNRSLIDQILFSQTRCSDIVQRYGLKVLFNFLPLNTFLQAHCGEHGKLPCLKKNKYSNLAFIHSMHHEYLTIAALFLSNMKILLQLLYRAEG